MNIFFGKISQKFDTVQLQEGYYSAPKGSTWFGELEIGDYVYMIGGDKVQFWQAKKWGDKNGRESLFFDVLNSDLGINVSQLIALKFLKITKGLAVMTSRSARNKAFFKLELIKDIALADLSNSQYYDNSGLYRTIKIGSREDINDNSEDIQLIYENNKLELFDNDFIENAIKKEFVDNLDKKGKGAKMKDTVLEFFSKAVNNLPVTISYKQIALRRFYDTFFCEYKNNEKYFVVGAFWDTSDPQDQTERFVKESIWFNGYTDKFNDEVNAVPVGSNIAIKAAFVREKTKPVMAIKARGIVIKNLKDGQTLEVEWEEDFSPFEVNFGGYMQTIKEVSKKAHIEAIWSDNEQTISEDSPTKNINSPKNMNFPFNQILYGPPGTGKTFNSINKALEIINEEEEKELNWKDRNAVKNLFDKRVDEGRIVFTTFHQSMSYEDFIEGIKPEEPEKEGDPVIYKIKYGILRNLCIEACFDIAQLREDSVTEQVLDFSFRYDKFVADTEEKLIAGETVKLKIKKGARVLVDSISQNGNVVIKHIDGNRTYTVSKNRLTKLNSAIKELNDITNIANEFKAIIGGSNSSAYWAVLNEVRNEGNSDTKRDKKIKYTFEEKNEVVSSLSKTDYSNKNGKPFVLIVDEINRGNVSQIFGELITLIEEDKRLGKEEALEVTLPYSKDKFGVPANLYIIGTMNTADRSVEALDAALRRRFHFEEMKPKPHLIKTESKSGKVNGVVDGIDLETLLTTINTRIEKLIDKDHRIGHSYFLKVNDSVSLLHSFKNEIIPLLEEYFFGDFGKIGLVLGSSFVEKVNGNFSFAKFEEYDNDIQEDLKQRTVYKIKEESEWKFSEI